MPGIVPSPKGGREMSSIMLKVTRQFQYRDSSSCSFRIISRVSKGPCLAAFVVTRFLGWLPTRLG